MASARESRLDPETEFHDQRSGLDRLSRVLHLDYAMPKQREGGVTLRIASNDGAVSWLSSRDLLQVSTGEALKFLSLTKSNQSVRQVLTGDNPCLGQHHVGAELIRRVLGRPITGMSRTLNRA